MPAATPRASGRPWSTSIATPASPTRPSTSSALSTSATHRSAAGSGTASYRQGRVYFLLGNYENSITLWRDRAIDEVRKQRSIEPPAPARRSSPESRSSPPGRSSELPEKVALQAEWEFELALAALEAGFPPRLAIDHFQSALKLEPNLAARPVIAYYLEKLGESVPPLKPAEPAPAPASPPAEAPKATEPPAASAAPAVGGEAAPKP